MWFGSMTLYPKGPLRKLKLLLRRAFRKRSRGLTQTRLRTLASNRISLATSGRRAIRQTASTVTHLTVRPGDSHSVVVTDFSLTCFLMSTTCHVKSCWSGRMRMAGSTVLTGETIAFNGVLTEQRAVTTWAHYPDPVTGNVSRFRHSLSDWSEALSTECLFSPNEEEPRGILPVRRLDRAVIFSRLRA